MTTENSKRPVRTKLPRKPHTTKANLKVSAATEDLPILDEVDPGDDGLGPVEQVPASRSVISTDRKKAFVPSKLSKQITAAVADEKGQTDPAKLRALAEANGVWNAAYANLNVGMQRMNIGMRLRAKDKRGETIKWHNK